MTGTPQNPAPEPGGTDDGRPVDAEWMTVPEVAAHMHVDLDRAWGYIKSGAMDSHFHRSWSERRVRRSVVEAFPTYTRTAKNHLRGWVYFIQEARPDGAIKIGSAVDVPTRRRKLQTGNPHLLVVLATTKGHRERDLHARFSSCRLAGEWFRPVPELLAFIEALKEEAA